MTDTPPNHGSETASGIAKQAAQLAGLLGGSAAPPPLVQNITNWVSMDLSANLLLAAGAAPAMVHAREEAAEFARIADALVVNIGTFEGSWREPARAAAAAARKARTPWVLDPVGCGATAFRGENAARLFAETPDLVRANASEVIALARQLGLAENADPDAGRGVDAGDPVEAALASARALARASGGVVLVTGARDVATDGAQLCALSGGSPLLAQVTATGCALSALAAALLARAAKSPGRDGPKTSASALAAAVTAAALFSLASERAARTAQGPGSFRVSFLDALSALAPAEVETFVAERLAVTRPRD